jgi:DNA-3-methyladenine glycosylase II
MNKDVVWNEQTLELSITVPKEFSFKENLNYLSRSSNECLFKIKEDKIYKAIPTDSETALIEVSAQHPTSLTIRFLTVSNAPSESIRESVLLYVKDWFDLERDLSPFYQLAKTDHLLQKATKSFYGLRCIGIPDLFEAISWGILGQQINLTYAYTLKRRLVEGFGQSIEHEGEKYWLYPTSKTIASLSIADLEGLRMTVKKCEYLIGVAKLLSEGHLSKNLLVETGDFKKSEKLLTNIHGIGPWTANYVLMRCLRFPTAFPIDDVGLHNAIKLLLKLEKKPTKKELLELSANWKGWESYATFYLWRFLY